MFHLLDVNMARLGNCFKNELENLPWVNFPFCVEGKKYNCYVHLTKCLIVFSENKNCFLIPGRANFCRFVRVLWFRLLVYTTPKDLDQFSEYVYPFIYKSVIVSHLENINRTSRNFQWTFVWIATITINIYRNRFKCIDLKVHYVEK